jgi:hypothetical protein
MPSRGDHDGRAVAADPGGAPVPTTVRLADLVAALSLGVDLGFGQPMEHVLRQCLIALRLAEQRVRPVQPEGPTGRGGGGPHAERAADDAGRLNRVLAGEHGTVTRTRAQGEVRR